MWAATLNVAEPGPTAPGWRPVGPVGRIAISALSLWWTTVEEGWGVAGTERGRYVTFQRFLIRPIVIACSGSAAAAGAWRRRATRSRPRMSRYLPAAPPRGFAHRPAAAADAARGAGEHAARGVRARQPRALVPRLARSSVAAGSLTAH